MLLISYLHTTASEIETVLAILKTKNLATVCIQEDQRYKIALLNADTLQMELADLSHIEQAIPFSQAYKLASRQFKQHHTTITVGQHTIGGPDKTIIAGPCAIESQQQIECIAKAVAKAGAQILRGGAFKPRTSPYAFQGLDKTGLSYLQSAARQYGLATVSEVMDSQDIDLLSDYVDILQIGARNMQNFSLLKQVGRCGKPILLKRGLAATYYEFLMAAEYLLEAGNSQVILCERGIRTFEPQTRYTLDLTAIPLLQQLCHLPVIVDPSHGTGIRSLVPAMSYAAIAAGAAGIMLEVHPEPDQALSDAKQTIDLATFASMVPKFTAIAQCIDH